MKIFFIHKIREPNQYLIFNISFIFKLMKKRLFDIIHNYMFFNLIKINESNEGYNKYNRWKFVKLFHKPLKN